MPNVWLQAISIQTLNIWIRESGSSREAIEKWVIVLIKDKKKADRGAIHEGEDDEDDEDLEEEEEKERKLIFN